MMKSELFKVFKSKRSLLLMGIMVLIPTVDLFISWYRSFRDYWAYPEAYDYQIPGYIPHPSFASFLSGSSEGHIFQMLLVWLLPLFLLLIYSDIHIQEKKFGYYSILLNKKHRLKTVLSKLSVSFLIPFAVCFLALGINFALANILFKGGTRMGYARGDLTGMSSILTYSMERPFFMYCVYILLFCFIAGGVGLMCTSLTFIFQDYKIVYATSFFIWIVEIAYPYSIINVIQPFIEYGLDYMIPGFCIFWSAVAVVVIWGIRRKVKCDEL